MKFLFVEACSYKGLLLALFFSSLSGCGDSNNLSTDITETLESGISALSGVIDDHNGTSVLQSQLNSTSISSLALCSRAQSSSCSGTPAKNKEAIYSSCSLGIFGLTVSGNVNLEYSSSSVCSGGLTSNADSVTRTYDYSITGPRGGTLRVFSSPQDNYNNVSISGGGRLTKTASGWDIEILGKNKTLKTVAGREIMNHSVRTTSAIQITGGLSRDSRVAQGGGLEVMHNLAEFTATHSFDQLVWDNTCCHPTSGTITTSLTGAYTGTATTEFTDCGIAKVTMEEKSRTLDLTYCE